MTVISCKDHKARKQHACDFCGLNIDPGETYRHTWQVYDGEAYAWRAHEFCHKFASDRLADMYAEDGVTYEAWRTEMHEWLVDLLGPDLAWEASQARLGFRRADAAERAARKLAVVSQEESWA